MVVWPRADSIATQSQVTDQFGGKVLERQPQAQKPQSFAVHLGDEANLSVAANTANAATQLVAGAQSTGRGRIVIPPEEVAPIEPSLLEGFVQPSWVNNIVAKPAAQQLTSAEMSFGRSATRGNLQNRVLASIGWLRNSEGSGYTVQFLSGETRDLEFAESFLEVLDEHDLMADSYVCMSSKRSYWSIKYGHFDGLSLAQDFIEGLPSTIYEYKPFVQNMSRVECNTNNSLAALILE